MGRRFSINIYLEGVEFRMGFGSAEEQSRAVQFLHKLLDLPGPPDLAIQPIYGLTIREYAELGAFLAGKILLKRKRSSKLRGKRSKKLPHPWLIDVHHVAGGGTWCILAPTQDVYERLLTFMEATLKLARDETHSGRPLYRVSGDQFAALRGFLDALEVRSRS